jgi:hypothetical protein
MGGARCTCVRAQWIRISIIVGNRRACVGAGAESSEPELQALRMCSRNCNHEVVTIDPVLVQSKSPLNLQYDDRYSGNRGRGHDTCSTPATVLGPAHRYP